MSEALLELDGVRKVFDAGRHWWGGRRAGVQALTDVSLRVRPKTTLGLVGESGSGKSTLAKVVAGLEQPSAGRVLFQGRATSGRAGELAGDLQMVFQDPKGSLNPKKSVRASVTAPLRGRSQDEQRARAARCLERVGLDPGTFLERYPHELSGGQAQRVALARALVVEPKLLILDEAVSSLDVSLQAQVLELLVELQRELDLTYLFISHDLSVVEAVCDDVAVLYLGRVVEHGTREQVLGSPRHPYTHALLSSVPILGKPLHRIALRGEAPSPRHPPSGCVFHPRCYRKEPRCEREVPELVMRDVDHPTACHFADDSDPERHADPVAARKES